MDPYFFQPRGMHQKKHEEFYALKEISLVVLGEALVTKQKQRCSFVLEDGSSRKQ